MTQPADKRTVTAKRETIIAAGWGFNVDQDFARAKTDIPIEIVEEDGPLGNWRYQGRSCQQTRVHAAAIHKDSC